MHRHLNRPLLLAAGIATAALVAAAAPSLAGAQAGPLDGEALNSTGFVTEGATNPPPPSICDPAGRSTVYFSATGIAIGPYPGTFTETGTITLGPQTLTTTPLAPLVTGTGLAGPVLTFEARFEIDSGTTTITGTKTLSAVLRGSPHINSAACASYENSTILPGLDPALYVTISGRSYDANVASTFEATIDDGATVSSTSGEAETTFLEAYFTGGTCQPDVVLCMIENTAGGSGFGEVLYSTPAVTPPPPPPPPVSGDCKATYGGWITAQNGDRGWFSGQAQSTSTTAPSGKQSYRDSGPAADFDFVSTETTAVTCTADSVQIYGRGTVDGGSPGTFRIELTDGGRDDTYRIVWAGATPYDSGVRALSGGNITVH